LDGVYVRSATGALEFRRAQEPTQEQLEALVRFSAQRIRALTGHTALEDLPVVEAPVLRLVGVAPEPVPPAPSGKPLTAEHDGFNLHAATSFNAEERAALERFVRDCARGPIALGRLSLLPNGNVSYRLKKSRPDGSTHLVFTPQAFLTRLSWLIAQPHIHLIRYHGVFAPNHAWRSEVVLRKPPEEESSVGTKPSGPAKGLSWAELLRRVFAVEVLVCTCCGGERRIIAEVEEGPIARKILAHLGLPTTAPKPAQGKLFSTGPPPVDEPEATVQWSDEDDDQCLPDSEQFI
jgi:hypothetical protein